MNEQLRALFAANSGLPYQSILEDANISRDLGLDSLDTVDLVLQMEDLFQISIPDEEYYELKTVRQFHDYLSKKVTSRACNCSKRLIFINTLKLTSWYQKKNRTKIDRFFTIQNNKSQYQ